MKRGNRGRKTAKPVLEHLETRVLLSAAGPAIIAQSPAAVTAPTDSITVQFDQPVDPTTFTPEDVQFFRTEPVLLGSYDTSGTADDVAVVGNLGYVADGGSGLRILDVSNPAAHVSVGTLATSGSAYGVAVAGDATPPAAPGALSLTTDTGQGDGHVTAATQLAFAWSAPADLAGIGGYEYRLNGRAWIPTPGTSVAVDQTTEDQLLVRCGRPSSSRSRDSRV